MIKLVCIFYLSLYVLFSPTRVYALSPEEIYSKVSPSIYRVQGISDNKISHVGSAVAVSSKILVSNCHVVLGGERFFIDDNNKPYPAFTFYHHKNKDLCLIYAPTANLVPVKMRRSSEVRIGEVVYAIGNPRNSYRTISKGIVSNKQETKYGYALMTDASIAGGSSGGGLFDKHGMLIGITTLSAKDSGDQGLAIPTEWIQSALPKGILDNSKEHDELKNSKSTKTSAQNNTLKSEKATNANNELIKQFGRDNVVLYKSNNFCVIHMTGKLNTGKEYGSALWRVDYPNYIFILPRATDVRSALNILSKYKNYRSYQHSYRYIFLENKMFELSGIPINKKYKILWFKHKENLAGLLMRGEYFTVNIQGINKFIKLKFGLYGFSAAYSAYSSFCK